MTAISPAAPNNSGCFFRIAFSAVIHCTVNTPLDRASGSAGGPVGYFIQLSFIFFVCLSHKSSFILLHYWHLFHHIYNNRCRENLWLLYFYLMNRSYSTVGPKTLPTDDNMFTQTTGSCSLSPTHSDTYTFYINNDGDRSTTIRLSYTIYSRTWYVYVLLILFHIS